MRKLSFLFITLGAIFSVCTKTAISSNQTSELRPLAARNPKPGPDDGVLVNYRLIDGKVYDNKNGKLIGTYQRARQKGNRTYTLMQGTIFY